ncbi:MAG: hypothetical protein IKQ45_06470 [Clostridia bacterium]|nr:hypothetical protein [Clostridia bacterium]
MRKDIYSLREHEDSPTPKQGYGKYGRSKAQWQQRNKEDARKKLNPRLVLSDPDIFFSDLLMEQQEHT